MNSFNNNSYIATVIGINQDQTNHKTRDCTKLQKMKTKRLLIHKMETLKFYESNSPKPCWQTRANLYYMIGKVEGYTVEFPPPPNMSSSIITN